MAENTENSEVQNEAAAEQAVEQPAAPAVTRHPLHLNGGTIPAALGLESQSRSAGDFKVGDVIKVHYRIKEGEKERVQVYEGTVISIRGDGLDKTFVVRRISHEVGVERIFPFNSPAIQKVDVVRRGRVRRAKLFFLRHKSGKEGRIKEAFDASRAPAPAVKKKATRTTKKTSARASAG